MILKTYGMSFAFRFPYHTLGCDFYYYKFSDIILNTPFVDISYIFFKRYSSLSFLFELNQYEIIPMIADIWYSKENSRFYIFYLE